MCPMCGGWWVKGVNENTTCCVGGIYSKECYVAEIDLGDLRDEMVSFYLSSGRKNVLGSMRPEEYDLGTFNFLTAMGSWYRSGGKFVVYHPGPVFTRLAENGVRCIMVPCFSNEQEELNNGLVTTISNMDISDIDTYDEQPEEACTELLGTGIFVAGQKVLDTE